MTKTFTIDGHKATTSSIRRFVAFYISYGDSPDHGLTRGPVRSITVFKRSDSVETLRTLVRRKGFHSSFRIVIVDTVTGEEVS